MNEKVLFNEIEQDCKTQEPHIKFLGTARAQQGQLLEMKSIVDRAYLWATPVLTHTMLTVSTNAPGSKKANFWHQTN